MPSDVSVTTIDLARSRWSDWRASRHAALTAPTGNLALIETRWLAPGEDRSLSRALAGAPDGVTATRLERRDPVSGATEHGIRLWDANSPATQHFVTTDPYRFDADWVLDATFIPAPPGYQVPFVHRKDNGAPRGLPVPGSLVFTVDGVTYTVHPFDDDGSLLLVFGDLTNGRTTYGGGRFLIVERDAGADRVVLDFNRAFTPPCGFSAHFNCPLPPPGNRFPFAIEAGERLPVFRDGFTVA